jgi:hypothetical protein
MLALEKIRATWAIADDEPLLADEAREEDFGWMFFYGSKRYQESGDVRYLVAGNGPVVVDHVTGEVSMLGTALGLEYQITEFRRKRNGPNQALQHNAGDAQSADEALPPRG